MRHRRRDGGTLEAALSATQVDDRANLTAADVLTRLEAVAPRCIRGRTRVPGVARRRMSLTVDGPVEERWTLGYLIDTIYLRDAWMHRIDICRATGHELVLTADHDGAIVADVVAEWSARHETPVRLVLTGPAGGEFGDDGADVVRHDAVEFCRTLAGRSPGTGLLDTIVPF